MSLMAYPDVLNYLDKKKRAKHLLIGNGFSIAYDPKIFSYNALSNFVKNTNNELLLKIFEAVKTKNFESIMQQLQISIEIIKALDKNSPLVLEIEKASNVLKESLIEAVKELHPEHVFKISEEESKCCSEFLQKYLSQDGLVFSSNYDLLLYWVILRTAVPNAIDGFGRETIDQGHPVPSEEILWSEHLIWGKNRESQNIYYLHGALPLFDNGIEIIKEEYNGHYLLDNIKQRMDKGHYPIFVTAGSSEEKLNHILHNHYLSDCYDKLCSIAGSLVTIGFNFGEYDEHIIEAINRAASRDINDKLWSVYIGVYSEADEAHIESIRDKFKCKITMFDSKTAKIWR
jgi:hypothetical protein